MYFASFPKINYDVSGNGYTETIRDITIRMKVKIYMRNNISLFDKYNVQDGERPELLAYQLYGDANFHWLILLFNNIVDPYYDWPLSSRDLQTYINSKYTNPLGVHHYELIQSSGLNTTKIIVELADEPTATVVTNIDYETELQNDKAQILLPRQSAFNNIIEEFKSEMMDIHNKSNFR